MWTLTWPTLSVRRHSISIRNHPSDADSDSLVKKFPYWEHLHGLWGMLPNFNSRPLSSDPGQHIEEQMKALVGTNVDLEIGGVDTPGGTDGLDVSPGTFEDDIGVRAHFLHRNKCLKLGQGTQGADAMTPRSSVPVSVPDSAVLIPGASASSSIRVKRKDPSDL